MSMPLQFYMQLFGRKEYQIPNNLTCGIIEDGLGLTTSLDSEAGGWWRWCDGAMAPCPVSSVVQPGTARSGAGGGAAQSPPGARRQITANSRDKAAIRADYPAPAAAATVQEQNTSAVLQFCNKQRSDRAQIHQQASRALRHNPHSNSIKIKHKYFPFLSCFSIS